MSIGVVCPAGEDDQAADVWPSGISSAEGTSAQRRVTKDGHEHLYVDLKQTRSSKVRENQFYAGSFPQLAGASSGAAAVAGSAASRSTWP